MSGFDISFVPEPFRSRIDCVHCGVMCKGGVHFLSVYFWCTEKLSKRNLDLMHYVGLVIKLISVPWLLGADWNMEPGMATSSGWLDLVKGK